MYTKLTVEKCRHCRIRLPLESHGDICALCMRKSVTGWPARIKGEREKRGWGKREMGRRLLHAVGIPLTPVRVRSIARQMQEWEKGTHFPREWARPYAMVFESTVDDLFPSVATEQDSTASERSEDVTEDAAKPDAETLLHSLVEAITDSAAVKDVLAGLVKGGADGAAVNDEPMEAVIASASANPSASVQGLTGAPVGTVETNADMADDWEAMERRHLLQLAVLMTGSGVLTTSEQKVRHLAGMVLTTAPRTLEEWEIVCADHLYAIRTRSPVKVREDMIIDLLAAQRQIHAADGEDPGELQRVYAALATLYANVLTRLGDHGAALRWWRTAREAADICGDPDLRLVVRGSEAGFGLYGQRAPETVLRLTESARKIGGNKSSVGLAKVISTEAKALSLLGRHDEAKQRTLELEEFAPGESAASPIPNIWTTDQVYFTRGWVGAGAGDESDVTEARSLVLAQSRDYQYFANTQLHQTLCAVVNGGVDQGAKEASALLDALPVHQRSQMITETGNRVLQSVPLNQRKRDSVKAFREVLVNTAPEVRSLNSGA